jgi:squalene-associated FAD-dependent desaturase
MSRRVAIVGGGLAGLAAAVALAGQSGVHSDLNLEIVLFESRRQLGGRATSYQDPQTGETIDNCQHVSLGCCTNFDDFCGRTGAAECLRTVEKLRFLSPAGRVYSLRRSAFFGAPLHLATSFLGLGYLSLADRMAVATAMMRLSKERAPNGETIAQWLYRHNQSGRSIALFWAPIITSALAEQIDRVSVAAARKVFVDAFLRNENGFVMRYPTVSLAELYDKYVAQWLERHGVQIRLGAGVRRIVCGEVSVKGLDLFDGQQHSFDCVIVAVPWFRIGELFEGPVRERLLFLKHLGEFESSPITSVHLWFDRPLFQADHLMLPGRFSQWLFRREGRDGHYYQAVISGTRELGSWRRGDIIARVCDDARGITRAGRDAQLVGSKVITEERAVFSPKPGLDAYRPSQATSVPNLFLAGDWTATGWPATMEGAVRSGYLAAEAVLKSLGVERKILVSDLPTARLSRWLFGID